MNKEPIRVLQVLTTMNLGGAETMVMNYYRNIDRTKVQFDFLLHRNERGFYDDEIESLGGKIYRMPSISPKNYVKYRRKLHKFFDEHNEYKIIHSHINALSSIILGVAKKKGVPCRIAHSHLAVESSVLKKIFKPKTDILSTIKDAIQSLVRFKVKSTATDFFACGKKAGEWLYGKHNGHRIKIIPNAIDASLFTFDENIADNVKSELKIHGKKVIGHVGRFNEQKNHFFLLKIFNDVLKKNSNYVLVLIGEGNLKTKIEQEAKRLGIYESIHFLGLRTDIPRLLQGVDVILFPSLYEGLPVTLIEAQASGLRITSSDTVTKEVDFLGLIDYVGLNQPLSKWSNSVISNSNYERKNTLNGIKKAGYDIYENANFLQKLYLSKY